MPILPDPMNASVTARPIPLVEPEAKVSLFARSDICSYLKIVVCLRITILIR